MPRVSVIIPTYNRTDYICEAVDSVLSQTYRDIEVIVVDDGSTDRTQQVLESYGDQIVVCRQVNAGVSAARNKGIELASGEWLAFLDSDDRWMAEKLQRQMDFIDRHPEIIAHTVNAKFVNLPGEKADNSFANCGFYPEKEEDVLPRPFLIQLLHSSVAMPPAFMCQKEAAVRAGLFDIDLSISEDYDFLCRMAAQGPWGYCSQELIEVLRREENMSHLSRDRLSDPVRSYKALKYVYNKFLNDLSLTDEESAAVKQLQTRSIFGLGSGLLAEGQCSQARIELQEGLALTGGSRKFKIAMFISHLPPIFAKLLMGLWRGVKYSKIRGY
ncbi:MAG: glycosyltransferase family 2 protein [Planctomycetota bacterium]|jgi:glycosyltransferase involved in cell wall biosynthesis